MNFTPKPSIKMLPVLAVDRSAINALSTGIKTVDLSTLGQKSFHFVNRSVADSKNPLHFGIGYAFPQILIYTVIKDVDGRILSYSRAKGTEDRLNKFNSIGFGGHVDVLDLQVDEQGAPDYIKTSQVLGFLTSIIRGVLSNRHELRGLMVGKSSTWQLPIQAQFIIHPL